MALQLSGILICLITMAVVTLDRINIKPGGTTQIPETLEIKETPERQEAPETDTVKNKLERIETKLTKLEKSSLPIALFASGIPIYAIGFASSLKDAIGVAGIVWINFMYLFIGSLLVALAMKMHKKRNRDSYIMIGITFGVIIIFLVINILRAQQ